MASVKVTQMDQSNGRELNKAIVYKCQRKFKREVKTDSRVICERELLGVLTTSSIEGSREESHSNRQENGHLK